MPKYQFTITRDLTESASVLIEADSIEEAQELGLDMAHSSDHLNWSLDEGNGTSPYLPDPDGWEEVEEEPVRLYRADIPLFATAYVKAATKTQARAKIKEKIAGGKYWLHSGLGVSGANFETRMRDNYSAYEATLSPSVTAAPWKYLADDLDLEEATEC